RTRSWIRPPTERLRRSARRPRIVGPRGVAGSTAHAQTRAGAGRAANRTRTRARTGHRGKRARTERDSRVVGSPGGADSPLPLPSLYSGYRITIPGGILASVEAAAPVETDAAPT